MSQAELHIRIYPTARKAFEDYMDFTNNYLTVAVFAEHRGISEAFAQASIDEGRRIHKLND